MADLISRQAAIDAVKKLTKWYYETYHETRPTSVAVIEELMDLPSAQPEIIRCRECKHRPKFVEPEDEDDRGYLLFPDNKCPCRCEDEWYNWMPRKDWYCGNAEREE